MPDPVSSTPLQPPQGPSMRGIVETLFISGACPFITYQLLTIYAPGLSKIVALAISGAFPAVHSLVGIVRRRYLDIVVSNPSVMAVCSVRCWCARKMR